MTESEALLFLGIEDVEELEDTYEAKVFEWKNFFVNRFPVPKLFQSKIKQIQKLEAAYQCLGGESDNTEPISIDLAFGTTFKEVFHQYSERRAALKARLFRANSASELVQIAQSLVDLTLAYARCWDVESLNKTGVVVSKEPDPMDLLEAINAAEARGVHNKSKIEDLPENHLLLNEVKRLSLLLRMNAT
ncbi:MAG: hypothetical protein NXI10_14270 [bacterium]|nr:hypothetical protein [bacterium]